MEVLTSSRIDCIQANRKLITPECISEISCMLKYALPYWWQTGNYFISMERYFILILSGNSWAVFDINAVWLSTSKYTQIWENIASLQIGPAVARSVGNQRNSINLARRKGSVSYVSLFIQTFVGLFSCCQSVCRSGTLHCASI